MGTRQEMDAVYGSTLAAIAANLTDEAAIEATRAPMPRPRRTELQIGILTQRAIAANRDGRYVEALFFLDQRARIAPLQKDLMLLRAFAYQNAGDYRSADRIFRAVDAAGPTPESQRAAAVAQERAFLPPLRSTAGTGRQ
jgi:Tfp pilus assembly protein PilF